MPDRATDEKTTIFRMEPTQMDVVFQSNFIDGRWAATGERSIEVVNPYTEQVIGRVPQAAPEEVDEAVLAARRSLSAWKSRPLSERVRLLRGLADVLARGADAIAGLISSEVGTPIALARRVQTDLPLGTLRSTASIAEAFPFEQAIGNSLVRREPVGVVAAITPWNFPLHQIVAKIAPALVAGCTVVIKPSELAPLNAGLLAAASREAGFPPGVINVVHGTGATSGHRLAVHPDVAMISFTGSTAVGRRLAREAGSLLKKTSMELGGKSASLVLGDGDLQKAVKATVASCLMNSGQTCSALTRLIVLKDRAAEAERLAADSVARYLPGNPQDPDVRLGPLISADQRERVWSLIETALRGGARLVAGGAGHPPRGETGYFVRPTVFADVDPRSEIAQEEVFGPVLCILRAEDEEHAVEIANGTPFGLAAAVWSSERAAGVAALLDVGQVDLNGAPFNPIAPFGGVKASGYGRELGAFGLEEFTVAKSMQH